MNTLDKIETLNAASGRLEEVLNILEPLLSGEGKAPVIIDCIYAVINSQRESLRCISKEFNNTANHIVSAGLEHIERRDIGIVCPKCGCNESVYIPRPPHMGIYCADCQRWLGWAKKGKI